MQIYLQEHHYHPQGEHEIGNLAGVELVELVDYFELLEFVPV